jgi:hypothetical protein
MSESLENHANSQMCLVSRIRFMRRSRLFRQLEIRKGTLQISKNRDSGTAIPRSL